MAVRSLQLPYPPEIHIFFCCLDLAFRGNMTYSCNYQNKYKFFIESVL